VRRQRSIPPSAEEAILLDDDCARRRSICLEGPRRADRGGVSTVQRARAGGHHEWTKTGCVSGRAAASPVCSKLCGLCLVSRSAFDPSSRPSTRWSNRARRGRTGHRSREGNATLLRARRQQARTNLPGQRNVKLFSSPFLCQTGDVLGHARTRASCMPAAGPGRRPACRGAGRRSCVGCAAPASLSRDGNLRARFIRRSCTEGPRDAPHTHGRAIVRNCPVGGPAPPPHPSRGA
jgi:hypothetical protein